MIDRKKKLIDAFNAFTGKNMEVLEDLYAKDVFFKDPVTKVQGLEALKNYYAHAYSQVSKIHFDFHQVHQAGDTFFCEWTMELAAKGLNWGRPNKVRGGSLIEWNSDNQVIRHEDFLDLGEMIYEQIPLFGKMIKTIKSKLH